MAYKTLIVLWALVSVCLALNIYPDNTASYDTVLKPGENLKFSVYHNSTNKYTGECLLSAYGGGNEQLITDSAIVKKDFFGNYVYEFPVESDSYDVYVSCESFEFDIHVEVSEEIEDGETADKAKVGLSAIGELFDNFTHFFPNLSELIRNLVDFAKVVIELWKQAILFWIYIIGIVLGLGAAGFTIVVIGIELAILYFSWNNNNVLGSLRDMIHYHVQLFNFILDIMRTLFDWVKMLVDWLLAVVDIIVPDWL